MRKQLLALSLAGVLAVACDDEPASPNTSGSIELTAAQAAAIKARVGQIAPVHPELSWLADTISMVIGAGLELEPASVTTNLAQGPFYAVSLQRTIRTSFSGVSSFDVILFNEPSNPTDFIIVSGWVNPGNVEPPSSLEQAFGSTAISTMNAHFFHVAGSTVQSWRAASGEASFERGTTSGSCTGVPSSASVTCQNAVLNAEFNVVSAMSDNPTVSLTRSASMSAADIAGIIIRMTIQ